MTSASDMGLWARIIAQSLSPLNRWYKIRSMRLKKGEWAILALPAITIGILLAAPAPEASPRLVSVQQLPDAAPMCEWNETGGAEPRLIASLGQENLFSAIQQESSPILMAALQQGIADLKHGRAGEGSE